MSDVNCFFIFGCPRSGTSLLSRMLDSHPKLSVPFESHIYKLFWHQRRFYADLDIKENQEKLVKDLLNTSILSYWSPTPPFTTVVSNLKHPGFAGVVDALMCSHSDNLEVIWGEKTPSHIGYWADIQASFPEAKFIHIVRDGRDVARSLVSARFGPTSLDIAAQHWQRYIAAFDSIKGKLNSNNFIQIKYEDLIAKPEATLEKVCQLLSIQYDSQMLNFYTKDVSYRTDTTNMGNLNSPVIKSNSAKWRTNLTFDEIVLIEKLVGHTLTKLNYDLDSSKTQREALNNSNKFKSYFLWLLARATDFQGQKEFININFIRLKRKILYYLG